MSTFKVGEVAVGCNHVHDTDLNGMECVVVESLAERAVRRRHNGEQRISVGYMVLWSDGERTVTSPHNLRKKRPPTTGEESILALFRQNQREGVAA